MVIARIFPDVVPLQKMLLKLLKLLELLKLLFSRKGSSIEQEEGKEEAMFATGGKSSIFLTPPLLFFLSNPSLALLPPLRARPPPSEQSFGLAQRNSALGFLI
ncbi:uncharacterized protein ASCRUDRAFT_113345 [Ascoidea rubescens DSM 1968]|uniref:Uncharacterized protein n=1 Tax=Ascoidea rubescens DSM 1968 TaxID=1344418 RepID=A0A1D2VC07_9ASCO|nr:hypothetical protein ASCRUDRAFT_113345 [Ascoidea rubescens DSM 1968]ODV59159.1 hypothetical protein ASCRUDRAFT_113345 [Ascoidea rubescens DSM 1968]